MLVIKILENMRTFDNKMHTGLEVLVTEVDNEKCPIDPQVCKLL